MVGDLYELTFIDFTHLFTGIVQCVFEVRIMAANFQKSQIIRREHYNTTTNRPKEFETIFVAICIKVLTIKTNNMM